jgi:hypothetical protein
MLTPEYQKRIEADEDYRTRYRARLGIRTFLMGGVHPLLHSHHQRNHQRRNISGAANKRRTLVRRSLLRGNPPAPGIVQKIR